jgi:hypothetical protein
VEVDWTKENDSQVGIQLTDLDSKEKTNPDPVAVQGLNWSFLHLLTYAKTAPAKHPANATLYTWSIPHNPRGAATAARFVVVGDPWAPFALGKAVGSASCRGRP